MGLAHHHFIFLVEVIIQQDSPSQKSAGAENCQGHKG